MNVWLAISLVLVVVTIYLLMIEFFSVAFKLTGLVTSKIKFQVACLFTGTGYTTTESELIAKDEKRRRIALFCMYSGHIFSVAFMGTIINVFISLVLLKSGGKPVTPHWTEWYFIILYVTSFFFLLVLFIKIPPVNRRFQRFLETIAVNLSRKNKQTNILSVLDLQGKHAIVEVILNIVPEYANEVPLSEMKVIKDLSIKVLSLRRDSRIIEVSRDTMFKKSDVLVVYGTMNDIKHAFVGVLAKTPVQEEDKSNEINLLNNYGSNALVEVYIDEVPNALKDVKIVDSGLKEKYDITVAILKRKSEFLTVKKDTIIEKGDTLTLYGPYQNIKAVFENCQDAKS